MPLDGSCRLVELVGLVLRVLRLLSSPRHLIPTFLIRFQIYAVFFVFMKSIYICLLSVCSYLNFVGQLTVGSSKV